MTQTERPEKVELTCSHCSHKWDQPTSALLAQKIVIYKGDKTVKRRITCPNCNKWVIVNAPAEWFDHE